MLCLCCMEDHNVKTVCVPETNTFKNIQVNYEATYFYCDQADEYYSDEQMITANDIRMKNAYRKQIGLLTTEDIIAIRAKFGISQSDLCLLLGWGEKTITRYESHQVQDAAHDTILRKLNEDPEWFLKLLEKAKGKILDSSYRKYLQTAISLFEKEHDSYLRNAITAKYARFINDSDYSGGKALDLNAVTDMIRYFANSHQVTSLYKVKLMKLLWYADALSYKRNGHAISGLVYRALPMGAVPIAYESIIDLSCIKYEETEIGEGTACHFLPTEDKSYTHLTSGDIEILGTVIRAFGKASTNEIVSAMHLEKAYIETAPSDIIQFKYAVDLSLN